MVAKIEHRQPAATAAHANALERKYTSWYPADPDDATEDEHDCFGMSEPVSPLHDVCNAVAVALVLREALPAAAADGLDLQLRGAASCTLHLLTDQGESLTSTPLLNHGTGVVQGPLQPENCRLEPGTAAWTTFASRQAITWFTGDASPPFSDWRAMMKAHSPQALVALPLMCPDCSPIGALTVAYEDPGLEGVVTAKLHPFAEVLARAISHNNKNLREIGLELLMRVMPPYFLRSVLLASTSQPSGTSRQSSFASTAVAEAASAVADPVQRSRASVGSQTGESDLEALPWHRAPPLENDSPTTALESPFALAWQPTQGLTKLQGAATCHSAALESGDQQSVTSLQFCDSVVEARFWAWFNAYQTEVDCQVSKMHGAMLGLLALAVLKGPSHSLPLLMAMHSGIVEMAIPLLIFTAGLGWYHRHRTALVAALRLTGTAALLAHWQASPATYAGSVVKALAGRAVGRLVLWPAHIKLRFTDHVLVTAAELALCVLADVCVFTCGSYTSACPAQGLGLGATLAAQVAAAALATLFVFLMEQRSRGVFLTNYS